jgi:hypothetical protein
MESRRTRGHSRAGHTVVTRSRLTLGSKHSHDSPDAILGRDKQSRLARGQPPAGDAVTTRLRPSSGGTNSHDSPKTNLVRETQLRLARDQPWARDAVTSRPRPTPDKQCIFDSPEGISGDAPVKIGIICCYIGNVCHTDFAYHSYVCRSVSMFHTFFATVATHGHIHILFMCNLFDCIS